MYRSPNCEISNEIRNLIIINYEGKKLKDIANMFHVNYNSVKTIVGRYKQHGSAEINQRSGRPKKNDFAKRTCQLFVKCKMKKNRRSTTINLISRVNEKQNIKISRNSLKRLLNKNGYL